MRTGSRKDCRAGTIAATSRIVTEPEILLTLADDLEKAAAKRDDNQLKKLEEAAFLAAKSFCGSWLGYHSRVYFGRLEPVPPGARFSVEWGFGDRMSNETTGGWVEFDFDAVVGEIFQTAGNPDRVTLDTGAKKASAVAEEAKATLRSAFARARGQHPNDTYLERLEQEIENEKPLGYSDFVGGFRGNTKIFTRDALAAGEGVKTPPHFHVLAEIGAWRHPFSACADLAKIARRAGSHLEILQKQTARRKRIGTHVFIGHGRSPVWKEFRDFVRDRLKLPWDEFNRVPVAGVANTSRLLQMLDNAAIAFLIMTAEDEQPDGKLRARMNVIHEVGLFQGRLGFERAIILLEEGCEDFSNVQGLGHIKFPRGDIAQAFEEVRRILEREELIDSPE